MTTFHIDDDLILGRKTPHEEVWSLKSARHCYRCDLPQRRGTLLFWSCPASGLRDTSESVSQKKIISQSVTYTMRSDPASLCSATINSSSHRSWKTRPLGHILELLSYTSGTFFFSGAPRGNELETFPFPNDPDRETITADLQGTSKLDFHLDLCLKLSESLRML